MLGVARSGCTDAVQLHQIGGRLNVWRCTGHHHDGIGSLGDAPFLQISLHKTAAGLESSLFVAAALVLPGNRCLGPPDSSRPIRGNPLSGSDQTRFVQ